MMETPRKKMLKSSDEERRIRIELAALYRWVHRLGWDDHIFTHLSARIPAEQDEYLLNPHGFLFDEITASSLIKVDLNGNNLDGDEGKVNWGGVKLHGGLYELKKQAACAIHLHTTPALVVSCQESGLLPLSQFAMFLHGKIGYHDYSGLDESESEKAAFIRNLGNHKILMLRNHGTLVWGESIAEAFDLCLKLERACAVQAGALASGLKLKHPGNELAQLTADQRERFNDPGLAFAAVLRRLDQLEPDYRQ